MTVESGAITAKCRKSNLTHGKTNWIQKGMLQPSTLLHTG